MWKSPKTSSLADGLIKRASSMSDEIAWKNMPKDKKSEGPEVEQKRSKTLSEVKSVNNIRKNLQSFPIQKEALPSHKLQEHTYE